MIGTLAQWQQGQVQASGLPDGVQPARQGFFQVLNPERQYYTDPNNPAGSRNYGNQAVAAPVLGMTASGMRYYATPVGVNENGEFLFDFSRPNLGTPDFNFSPELDPYVRAEQEREANPDGNGPRDQGNFTDPRLLPPPSTGGGSGGPPSLGGSGGQPPTGGGFGGGGVGPPGLGSPGGGQPPVGGGFGPGAGPYTPNYPPPVTLPDYNTPPSGGPVVGGEPGQPAPGGGQPGGQPGGLLGPYASFGFAPGPAGGLLPIMLNQGTNPFQNQQPGGGPLYPGGTYTQPTQLAQALFNPNIQGYQWFQPPPPAEGATANPNQPPPNPGTGGGYTGPPNYSGGYDPNTGTYYEMMRSQGLLGMPQTPAALKGLLG